LANELFYHIKKLESSSLKTMFRKYETRCYLEVAKVISKIEMQPDLSRTALPPVPATE